MRRSLLIKTRRGLAALAAGALLASGLATHAAAPGKLYAIGGFDPDDTGMVPHRIYEIDPTTGQATPLPGTFGPEPGGLAATADGRLLALDLAHSHGSEPEPEESTLLEIDPYKGFLTKIATVPLQATGFDILPDGRAFTIPLPGGAAPGQLHAVNLGTGAVSPIGSASAIDDAFNVAFGSAPAANKRATQLASVGGQLYAAVRHGSIANLVSFDPNTGAATVIGAANAVNTANGGAYRGIPGLSGRDSNGDGQFDELYGVLNYHDHDGDPETYFQVIGALIKFDLNDGTWSIVGTNPGLLFSGLASTAGLNPTPVDLAFTFEPFTIAEASETLLADIRNDGALVGRYKDVEGLSHGFLQVDGTLTTFNVTGNTTTFAAGVDDAGRVVGFYRDAVNPDVQHGFLRASNGTITTIDGPGGVDTTYLWRLNAAGQMSGYVFDSDPFFIRAFRRESGGAFNEHVFPGSPVGTVTRGLNEAGDLVGWKWTDAFALEGVVFLNDGTTNVFTIPGWANTLPGDINALGEIAGTVINADFSVRQGFYRRADGAFTVFAPPGAVETEVFGLNDAGVIVGEYVDAAGKRRGFLARPARVLDRGEVDLGLAYEDGKLEFHAHDETNDVEYSPEGVVLAAGVNAEQFIPDTVDFSFLGEPGRSVWILPATENEDLLFLGLAAEEIESGVFVNDALRVELVSVEGAGDFFLYRTDAFGTPQIHMNSADGIGPADFFALTAGDHQHVNWAFSAPGSYRIGLRATGTLVEGNQAIASDVFYFTFHIPAAELPQPEEPDDSFVYKVAILDLEGANYLAGEEVNESGVVAVGAYDENDFPVAARFANELTLLDPLTSRGAYANSINDAGMTAGWALNDAGLRRPVAWSDAIPTDLGTLGGDRGEARSINNAGQIVGQARNAANEARAFLWTEGGGMTELPMTLGGDRSAASAINSAGIVAGSGRRPDGNTHAVRYDPATPTLLDLGTLGGDNSFANGINDAGHVVGLSDAADGSFRPFFWSPETEMLDVFAAGDLGSPHGAAYDLNAAGQVVGYGEINDDYDSHAFVWTRTGGLKNLNDLVVRLPGLELYGAAGINDAGQIVGWGILDGSRIGYRLHPATRLKRGEVDLGLAWEDGELEFHAHDHAADIEYAADAVVLHVPALAQTAVPANPAFAFLGSAGAPVWILPQAENPKLLFLGLAAEEIAAGVFVNDQVTLRLLDVNGPGHFSVYAVDGFGQPVIYMNTGDGIGPADTRTLTVGAHEHVNWGFTAPGLYRVRFQAAGTLVEGGVAVASEEFEVCFEVIGIRAELGLQLAGETGNIGFDTQDGIIYQLLSALSVNGPWGPVGQPFIGTGRSKQLSVPVAGPAGYFQLQVVENP